MSKVTDINYYKRRKRRKAGNTRWVLFIVFLFTCAVGGYFFALSPFFFIYDIEVTGNKTVDEATLLDLSSVNKGENIFTVDLNKTRQMILIDPQICECKIERRLPGTLKIQVTEREAVAIIPTGNGFLYVDQDGVVLSRYREVKEILLPILVGIGDFLPGSVPGTHVDAERLATALDIVVAMPENSLYGFEEINVSDEQKIITYVHDGIKVMIGDKENISSKTQLIEKILEEIENSGKNDSIQYIDVSILEKPVIYYK